jgi:hypothetical protein
MRANFHLTRPYGDNQRLVRGRSALNPRRPLSVSLSHAARCSDTAALATQRWLRAEQQGHDFRLLQDFMGHRDPRHTSRYTRTASRRFEGLWK